MTFWSKTLETGKCDWSPINVVISKWVAFQSFLTFSEHITVSLPSARQRLGWTPETSASRMQDREKKNGSIVFKTSAKHTYRHISQHGCQDDGLGAAAANHVEVISCLCLMCKWRESPTEWCPTFPDCREPRTTAWWCPTPTRRTPSTSWWAPPSGRPASAAWRFPPPSSSASPRSGCRSWLSAPSLCAWMLVTLFQISTSFLVFCVSKKTLSCPFRGSARCRRGASDLPRGQGSGGVSNPERRGRRCQAAAGREKR